MRYLVLAALLVSLSLSVFAQRDGTPANFSATTLDGRNVELNALKGNVVLIMFWSTRCPICRAEIPKLNRLASAYSGRGVTFLAPTADPEDKVRNYLPGNPFDFEILPGRFDLLLKFARRDASGNLDMGYPSYFLLDQRGDLVYRANGWDHVAKITSSIDKLLAKHAAE